MFTKSAFDCWNEERQKFGIVTLCKDLDEAIGNKFPLGVVTELVGAPGCGKTQICLQLCANVQIPANLYGLEGAAVYIDTNRGFTVNRLKEIATATNRHCEHIYRLHNIARSSSICTVDSILKNVFCTFCNSYIELLAAIYNLRDLLTTNHKIRLIIIDSFSYLFRDSSAISIRINRVQLMYQILSELQQLAVEFNCAVIITNEITTRFRGADETYLVPALGDSHIARVNYLITVNRDSKDTELFVANIDKSFYNVEKLVPFRITKEGIRQAKNSRQQSS